MYTLGERRRCVRERRDAQWPKHCTPDRVTVIYAFSAKLTPIPSKPCPVPIPHLFGLCRGRVLTSKTAALIGAGVSALFVQRYSDDNLSSEFLWTTNGSTLRSSSQSPAPSPASPPRRGPPGRGPRPGPGLLRRFRLPPRLRSRSRRHDT